MSLHCETLKAASWGWTLTRGRSAQKTVAKQSCCLRNRGRVSRPWREDCEDGEMVENWSGCGNGGGGKRDDQTIRVGS